MILARRNNKRRTTYLAATLAIAAATLPTIAQAATATWLPEKLLATKLLGATDISTAVNPAGAAVVVWDKYIGTDATHPYGIFQVYAAGRTAQGTWSAPAALSSMGGNNGGATVDPATGAMHVFYTSANVTYEVHSADFGLNWSIPEIVPVDPGYGIPTVPGTLVGSPWVDIDGAGNSTLLMLKPHGLRTFDAEVIVKNADGTWSAPQVITGAAGSYVLGSIRLCVISDGQALVNIGAATFRRTRDGVWAESDVPLAGMGQVFSTSATLDASGKAYFLLRTHYVGAQLFTQLPGKPWSAPRQIARLEPLGSSLVIEGASAGHAMAYGIDYTTGYIRASVTSNSGAGWGALASFGTGQSPQGVGSENGLFALSWNGAGVNWDRMMIASGSGIAGTTTAWAKTNMAGGFATGPVAIAGTSGQASAQLVSGWLRTGTLAQGQIIGTKTGVILP